MAALLAELRARGGRLFFLGVGGSAANCSHAVNDFRKIAGIEAYTPTDNVSELTARTNDEGWETVFVEWLKGSRLQRDGHAVRASRSAAAASRRTSARIWCARCSYAQEVGAPDRRRRRPRRRLHRAGRRRLRDRADRQSRQHHAARRGVPGAWSGTCSSRIRRSRRRRRNGNRPRRSPRRLPRPRRCDQPRRSSATASRIRRRASRSSRLLPGVPEALARLRDAGFRLVVVTNQPDVARGTQRRERSRGACTRGSARALPIDEFRVCYHDDADGCACRKPKPGHAARGGARRRHRPRRAASWSAIAGATSRPASRAGCATVFIDYGYDERRPDGPDAVVALAAGGRRLDSVAITERGVHEACRSAVGEDLCRRRRPGRACSSCTASRTSRGSRPIRR